MKNSHESKIIEVEHCGNDHLDPIHSICEIPVHGFPKPQGGGLWTSPIDSEYSWRKWCLREDFHAWQLEKSFRLKVDTSRLLIIDSLDDLIRKMVHPHIMELGQYGLLCINWGELVKMYDGIWLTVRGMMETYCSYPYFLHCWDCETVFLFNEKPIIEVLTNKNEEK